MQYTKQSLFDELCDMLGVERVTLKVIKERLTISKGNSKVGNVHNISTLPGNHELLIVKKDGTILCDVPGTCGENCLGCYSACYARRIALRYTSVRKAWAKNTILKRSNPKLYYMLIDAYFYLKEERNNFIDTFRWNVSGEVFDSYDFACMNLIAVHHPACQFYDYTKNFVARMAYHKNYGKFAPNLHVNLSAWKGNYKAVEKIAYITGDNIFAYADKEYEKTFRDEKYIFCPAVKEGGREDHNVHCEKCGLCRREGLHIAVRAH